MHISKSYTNNPGLGALSHPPLENSAARPIDPRFGDEINERGVYIHKMNISRGAVNSQFEKIKDYKLPTPGTFVGVGVHRTYNLGNWLGTSGLIFSPDTVSVLSYKGGICSVRLAKAATRNFSMYNSHKGYSRYLAGVFNTKCADTQSAFKNRNAKNLRLVEDAAFAKNKYKELELRSNLAFKDELPSPIKDRINADVSSKFTIVKLLQSQNIDISKLKKSQLLKFLKQFSEKDTDLGHRLRHAVNKIERFDGDKKTQAYLRLGLAVPIKKNHYSNIMRVWGAQTPNEHLLLPTLANIAGVCVNVESTSGIDQAFEINAKLNDEQEKAQMPSRNNPALVYNLSPKIGKSLVHLGWTQCVAPWSSKGLIEFAKTGHITEWEYNKYTPNHFMLIHTLADAGALVFFEDEKALLNCKFKKNFVDDLSSIKENNSNLLHIAIENNRPLDDIKFFYFWQVKAFTQRNSDNRTALDLAILRGHESHSFLDKANSWNKEQLTSERNAYISGRLDKLCNKLGKKEASYRLRDGRQEDGKIMYIPQLGSYRVIKGSGYLDKGKNLEWTGVQKYCNHRRDLALSIASVRNNNNISITNGIYDSVHSVSSTNKLPSVFYQHRPAKNATANFPRQYEVISFVSNLPAVNSVCVVDLRDESRRNYIEAHIHGGLRASQAKGVVGPDRDSCTYFNGKIFLPRDQKEIFSNIATKGDFTHLSINYDSFDSGLDEKSRKLFYFKYLLANIRYLSGWEKSIEKLGPVESAFLAEQNPHFIIETKSLLREQRIILHELMKSCYRKQWPEEFDEVDKYKGCLLREFSKEYLNYSDAEQADVQYILAKKMRMIEGRSNDDRDIAKMLFEKAASHSHVNAISALASMAISALASMNKKP